MENKLQYNNLEEVQIKMQKQTSILAGMVFHKLLQLTDEVDTDTGIAMLEGMLVAINESRRNMVIEARTGTDANTSSIYEKRLVIEKLNSLRIRAIQRDVKAILEHLKN